MENENNFHNIFYVLTTLIGSYARKFATDSRQLFKIGVNFSSKTRRIEAWKIED